MIDKLLRLEEEVACIKPSKEAGDWIVPTSNLNTSDPIF